MSEVQHTSFPHRFSDQGNGSWPPRSNYGYSIEEVQMMDLAQNAKFFAMSYNATNNIGDEIQSLAARQFLPRVDYYIERERTNSFLSPDKTPVWGIMNG